MTFNFQRTLLFAALALTLFGAWIGYGIWDEIERSHSEDPLVWEDAIKDFDRDTASGKLPEGAVIFIGSSSIRLWSNLEEDMAPLPVIQRGFGGAKINDVVHYTERLVAAPSPRAIVLFAGSNDIQPGLAKRPEVVLASYRAFVERTRKVHRDIPIYYIGITPSVARWEIWPIAQQANRLIKDYSAGADNLFFIDTTASLLGADGTPDADNYIFDGLHLSAQGYTAWTKVIRPRLLTDAPGRPSRSK